MQRIQFKYFANYDNWSYKLRLFVVFGVLATISTHSGIVVDIDKGFNAVESLNFYIHQDLKLTKYQAIISFRDTTTMIAGLIGGVWVGFGTGLIAGLERLMIGGFVAPSACIATIVLGIYAGFVSQLRPKSWSWYRHPLDIIVVALFGSILQQFIILLLNGFNEYSIRLSLLVGGEIVIINIFGCWLFRSIERFFYKLQADGELRALHAQVSPHFLTVSLRLIADYIEKEPKKSEKYILELIGFLSDTKKFTDKKLIKFSDELNQVNRYIDLQNLHLKKHVNKNIDIPFNLTDFYVPTKCILTIVENSIKYDLPSDIFIKAEEKGYFMIITITDNGKGITGERLSEIIKKPVKSELGSSGTALFNLNRSLNLIFDGKASFVINSVPYKYTNAIITLPKRNYPWTERDVW